MELETVASVGYLPTDSCDRHAFFRQQFNQVCQRRLFPNCYRIGPRGHYGDLAVGTKANGTGILRLWFSRRKEDRLARHVARKSGRDPIRDRRESAFGSCAHSGSTSFGGKRSSSGFSVLPTYPDTGRLHAGYAARLFEKIWRIAIARDFVSH